MDRLASLGGLLDPSCAERWKDGQFLDLDCLKLALSKGLGLGIVLGGSIVKVPQIVKIQRSHSTRGLSALSLVLETLAFAITTAYNLEMGFPYSTFGESLALVVQNLVILAYILQDSRGRRGRGGNGGGLGLLATLAVLATLVGLRTCNRQTLGLLQALTIPISLSSKIPQIVNNARQGSTGELAAFTVFNYLLGSTARLFTTAVETGDRLILLSYALGTALNAVLALQMILYWQDGARKRA